MRIIAVTSCPVGAAHTYMAAAALEKGAAKTGHQIKIETQGSLGFKNKIGADDVSAADIVILACDVACLEIERFNGKPVIEFSTKQCIKDPVAVITEAFGELEKGE